MNVLVVRVEESLQLRNMIGFNPTYQGEECDLLSLRSFDPETHPVLVSAT